ncbi:hypothetical protein CDD83_8438 [Cordyceps sp. RAO-2017]|nr:hypothetical protein CDD83_8438 [Cordyceps sp. RAO-2017]
MAQLQAKIDAVKAAVSSTSTCTPATVAGLKELLLPEPESKSRPASRPTKAIASTRTKAGGAAKHTVNAQCDALLGVRERTVLATHVINASLKSLAEAAKPPPPVAPCKQNENLRQAAARRSLRRSASAPLSPLQPRTLNRVATSPNLAQKEASHVPPSQSTGCLATAECARVAFACLRSVKGPVQGGQSDFQLENGMSALVGRLLSLGLHDQALKELRVLKKRLDGSSSVTATVKNSKATAADSSNSSPAAIADLLDFGATVTKQSLAAVTTCQTQVLKLVAATKKPAHVEALLPALLESNPSSPINLLSKLAGAGDKEAPKVARQMASLCQILFSVVPSVSSSEDAVATEPRLSPSPTVVLELQSLALRTQMKWWLLAGHQGKVDDEILSPFSRCIRAFVRRQKSDEGLVYRALVSAFEGIMLIIRSQNCQPASSSKSPLSSIYQTLGSAAHTARQYDEAYSWLQSLRSCLCPQSESLVRIFSVTARILAAALKRSELSDETEQLMCEVVAGLDGSLSGTVSELNELLDGLSAARRSVVGLLKKAFDSAPEQEGASAKLVVASKDFILRFPRFVRRWVGSPPGRDASAKQALQFDQRRDTVMQSIGQILDAALMVLKCDIQAGSSEWQLVDDVLQHCASLLDSVCGPALSISKAEQLASYHVKISSLYFAKFLELRKMDNRSRETNKQLLQALSRSIDAVKDRSLAEKDRAQLATKLEFFADLCKELGRADDAVRTLRSICTSMAEDGVLSEVAAALATRPPALAWATTEKASSLSRALRSIAKLDRSWNDWTFFLPEAERAAVLEHLMHLSSGNTASFQPLRLHDPSLTALLRIYTLEKYPIRRLRVLLHIFYQNIGEEADSDELASHLDQALRQLQRKDKAEDAALCHFIPHLESYHALVAAMAESESGIPMPAIRDSISSWKAMAEACKTRDDVYAVIDNPEDLLDHLQSLHQLAGLRGDLQLQLSVSELAINLARAVGADTGSAHDSLILSHGQLAAQYVSIGRYPQALQTLERTKALLEQRNAISRGVLAELELSRAEYYSGIGAFDEALKHITMANDICGQAYSNRAPSRSRATVTLSMASLLRSTVSLHKGDVQSALETIKSSVRMLSHDWSKLEASVSANAEASTMEDSTASVDVKPETSRASGPRFWRLASPLLRSLLHISSVYAHIGMFQETIYYAESAWKVAEGTQSPLFRAQVAAWMGSVYAKADMLDKALAKYEEAKEYMPQDACSWRVRVARQLGDFYGLMGDGERACEYLKMAEDTIHQLSSSDTAIAPTIDPSLDTAVTKTKATKAANAPRATRATRSVKAPAVPRGAAKRGPTARAKLSPASSLPQPPKDVYQASLFAAVILSRVAGLLQRGDWSSALSTLDQAKGLPKLLGLLSEEQVVTAASLIGHSMEQMASDPVFSVVQDSTMSFPAVCGAPDKGASERSAAGSSPPRKARAAGNDRKGGKERGGPAFVEALKTAHELLTEAHASALSKSDSATLHRISALLQSTVVLLSATTAAKARPALSSSLATVAVDLGRNAAWIREQKTVTAAPDPEARTAPGPPGRRCSLDVAADLGKFQNQYVEAIPKSWSVISLSLSDNRHDLCVSKLQAGHSPFILRLPLERANSRDADSEVFNFEHGREELETIIKLANETSHSARDFKAKGEMRAWWSEREALDSRLRDLLATMETTWLGGFRGVFSQHRRRPDLLARFHKSFQQMLDGSLPRRRRRRRR